MSGQNDSDVLTSSKLEWAQTSRLTSGGECVTCVLLLMDVDRCLTGCQKEVSQVCHLNRKRDAGRVRWFFENIERRRQRK